MAAIVAARNYYINVCEETVLENVRIMQQNRYVTNPVGIECEGIVWKYEDMLTIDWNDGVLEILDTYGEIARLDDVDILAFEKILVDFWMQRNSFVKNMCKTVAFEGTNVFATDDGNVYAYRNCGHILLLGLSSATSYIYVTNENSTFYLPYSKGIWSKFENSGGNVIRSSTL